MTRFFTRIHVAFVVVDEPAILIRVLRGGTHSCAVHGCGTPAHAENGKILYAYFSGDGSGSSSGGGNSSQTNTDELDSVTTKYALKNLDTGKFLCGLEDTDPNEGYDQAYAASVSFKSGVRFALCDTESDGQPTWVCNINPWSFNSNGASENVTTYLTVGDSYWTVVKDFTADVYAQFKYGSDRIYFGLK